MVESLSAEEAPKAVLMPFFDQIVSGIRSKNLVKYQRFAHFPEETHGNPVWPLCFIATFLKLSGREGISILLEMVVRVCEGGFEHSDGMEWQALVVASAAINISAAQFIKLPDGTRFIIGSIANDSFFRMIHLPHHIATSANAEQYIVENLSLSADGEVGVILAYATHPAFQSFDCLILHWDGKNITLRIGLQAKQGGSVVKENAPDGWKGFLFRGDSPSSAGTVKKAGWTYLTEDQVTTFIPFSLRSLIPTQWPSA